MAYIYKISNSINSKLYIGKTLQSIETRFYEHYKESLRERGKNRPLYNAINKYGFDKFSISLIEECSFEEVNERESFWINRLNSYSNGYNATLGGDGTSYYDYFSIAQKYKETGHQKETANFFNCDVSVVRHACKELNVPISEAGQVTKQKLGKSVQMLSLSGILIKEFNCMMDAADWIKQERLSIASKNTIVGHISEVCRKKRKTAYKHLWKYV